MFNVAGFLNLFIKIRMEILKNLLWVRGSKMITLSRGRVSQMVTLDNMRWGRGLKPPIIDHVISGEPIRRPIGKLFAILFLLAWRSCYTTKRREYNYSIFLSLVISWSTNILLIYWIPTLCDSHLSPESIDPIDLRRYKPTRYILFFYLHSICT